MTMVNASFNDNSTDLISICKTVAQLQLTGLPLGKVLRWKAQDKLRSKFEMYNHKPSAEMWQGLEALLETLSKMATGEATKNFYLSSLDPGVGKTTAICSWLETYLEHLYFFDEPKGVIIGLDTLDEIRSLVKEAKIPGTKFAVLVSESTEGGSALNAFGVGRTKLDLAPILFTTKAQIQLRCSGKMFGDVEELFFDGKPRAIKIWDESLFLGKPLTLSRLSLGAILPRLEKVRKSRLADLIEGLMFDLKTAKDGEQYQVPDLPIDSNDIAQLFDFAKGEEREMADVLSIMAGKVVTARHDHSGIILVDCEESIPADFAPCLITDASGRIRETYNIQSKYLDNLVRLKPEGSVKRYDKLEIKLWGRGSGSSYYRQQGTEWTAQEVAKVIKGRPGEEFLIVHHKGIDLPGAIKAKLESGDVARVNFLHYGKHTATNKFSSVPNVVLAGMLYYKVADYEALA